MPKVMSPKRKVKVLSLSDKLCIIKAAKDGKSRDELSKQFEVPLSTLCRILKKGDAIESQCAEGHGNIKRITTGDNPEIEMCLVQWVKQCNLKNVPISGQMIKEKAQEFATKVGVSNVTFSNGWLQGFKKRNGLCFKKMCGESKAVDDSVCNQWQKDLPLLLRDYSPNDIFNGDETGLLFKCLPDKTFTFTGEQCHGGKQSKDRITVLVCSNMTGTEKLPLLVIGKSKRPRCFKGVKSLPVTYKSNAKAWMTRELFKEWLLKIDADMRRQKRMILLFVDNCMAHTDVPKLTNVKVLFLPANTTSKLQPCDQGIIHSFKCFYRADVVRHVLKCIENNVNVSVDLLQALRFARKAWFFVTQKTISNCFKKAGFQKEDDEDLEGGEDLEGNEEDEDESVGVGDDDWSRAVNRENSDVASLPTFDDFARVDDNIAVSGELSVDDIVNECVNSSIEEGGSDDEGTDGVERPLIKKDDALKLLENLHFYFERVECGDKAFEMIYSLEKCVNNVSSTEKQTKITDFL